MDLSNTKIILGFDQGFSAVKVHPGIGEPFKIENVIAEVDDGGDIVNFNFNNGTKSKVYDFEGKKYILGKDARGGNITHYRNVDYLIKYAPLFLTAAIDRLKELYNVDEKNIVCVCAGLPLNHFGQNHQAYRSRIKNFTVNGREYAFEKVYVSYQGVGGFADYFYSWGKETVDNGERGFVWDVGENTMIIIAYEGLSLKKDGSRQYDGGGISGIYDQIRHKVSTRLGREPDVTDFRTIIKGLPLKSYGENIDFSDIVSDGIKFYLENTYRKIMDTYRAKFAVCDKVILIGGGAYALSKYITEENAHKILFKTAPQPDYANVRGYRQLA